MPGTYSNGDLTEKLPAEGTDVRLCQECGKPNREQAHFCDYCGRQLQAAPHVPVGEMSEAGGRSELPVPACMDERPTHRLSFHGAAGSLFGIYIVNIFLTLLTLGTYHFWGKVRVQRYLWSQTEFAGDRFAYHGTGRELFRGFLKAALVFGIPFVLLSIVKDLPSAGAVMNTWATVLNALIALVFMAVATVGARRYRLSRTSWRGIRFSFRGRAVDFIKLYLKGALLTVITLGLYYPIFATRRYGFLVSHSYFGNQVVRFDGRGRELLGSFVLTLLLSLLSLFVFFIFSIFFWVSSVQPRPTCLVPSSFSSSPCWHSSSCVTAAGPVSQPKGNAISGSTPPWPRSASAQRSPGGACPAWSSGIYSCSLPPWA
jgi:uncharacterized protein DUF898